MYNRVFFISANTSLGMEILDFTFLALLIFLTSLQFHKQEFEPRVCSLPTLFVDNRKRALQADSLSETPNISTFFNMFVFSSNHVLKQLF